MEELTKSHELNLTDREGGFIAVHNQEAVDDLLKSCSSKPKPARHSGNGSKSQSSMLLQTGTVDLTTMSKGLTKSKFSISEHDLKRVKKVQLLQAQWDCVRNRDQEYIKEHSQFLADQSDEETEQRMKNITVGTSEFTKCQDFVNKTELYETKRLKRQCKSWNEAIFDPVQDRISSKMTPEFTATVSKARYQAQLNYAQGKPLTAQERKLFTQRVNVSDLRDPLKSDLLKIDSEKKIATDGRSSSIFKPVTKPMLDPRCYDRMDHLPAGKDEQILKRLRGKKIPQFKTGGKVLMNQFNNICSDQKVVKQEYFPGGLKQVPTHKDNGIF